MARWSRSESASNIGGLHRVQRSSIPLMRLLAEEAGDANDGRRADAGAILYFTIREPGSVEQASDVPAFGEGADLGGRTEVGEKAAHFAAIPRSQQRRTQIVGQ